MIFSLPTNTLHGSYSEDRDKPDLEKIQQFQISQFASNGQNDQGDGVKAFVEKADVVFSEGQNGSVVHNYSVINYINKDLDVRQYSSATDTYEREIFSLMEHELGHLIAPAGYSALSGNRNFRECVAEAFSFLRQQQQYHSVRPQVEISNYWDRILLFLQAALRTFMPPS